MVLRIGFCGGGVRRSKLLPRGGMCAEQALKPLGETLAPTILHARTVAQTWRTQAAETRWEEIYAALAEGQPRLLGAITARAEAQGLRLSCLYALLDKTDTVDVSHLDAAYALWRYCDASSRYIFGTTLGDPLANAICRITKRDTLTPSSVRQILAPLRKMLNHAVEDGLMSSNPAARVSCVLAPLRGASREECPLTRKELALFLTTM